MLVKELFDFITDLTITDENIDIVLQAAMDTASSRSYTGMSEQDKVDEEVRKCKFFLYYSQKPAYVTSCRAGQKVSHLMSWLPDQVLLCGSTFGSEYTAQIRRDWLEANVSNCDGQVHNRTGKLVPAGFSTSACVSVCVFSGVKQKVQICDWRKMAVIRVGQMLFFVVVWWEGGSEDGSSR